MSFCTRGRCPCDRDVFVWLGDGPEADGTYPWVHAASAAGSGGHLEVCGLMPFATAEEAGEVCACGHESRRHEAAGGVPAAPAVPARLRPCPDCGCTDFRHRPAGIERWREGRTAGGYATLVPASPAAGGVSAPGPAGTGQLELFPGLDGHAPAPGKRRRRGRAEHAGGGLL